MSATGRGPSRHDVQRVVLCTAAVLVAHAVAATLVEPRPYLRLPDPRVPTVASVRVSTVVREAGREATAATPAAPSPSPDPAPATATAAVAAAPRPIAASTLAVGHVESELRFYRFGEVDVAAEPETGWNLQLETLDAARLDGAAFDVWIDAGGRILACTLVETHLPVSDATRAALEAEVLSTVLVPAVRHGVRVASHRRVEIYVDGVKTSRDSR